MTVLATHQKDQGKVRERQEDNCYSYADHKKALLIVSDGMGGHAGGDLASMASVEAAQAVLQKWPDSTTEAQNSSAHRLDKPSVLPAELPSANVQSENDRPPNEILSHSPSTVSASSMGPIVGSGNLDISRDLDIGRDLDNGRGVAPIPNFAVKVDEWIPSDDGTAQADIEIPQREQVVATIKMAFSQAQHAVCNVSDMKMGLGSAGCTLTIALIANGWLHIGHVGDSRAYIYRRKELEQVTMDHSGAMLLVSAGLITLEEARDHPESHSLYRFLGINALDLTVDIHHKKLQQDDLILLCSDGLWGMLEDEQLASLLGQRRSLNQTALTMIEQANEQGGNDNISVAIAAMY